MSLIYPVINPKCPGRVSVPGKTLPVHHTNTVTP